jgi:hypothetical protein
VTKSIVHQPLTITSMVPRSSIGALERAGVGDIAHLDLMPSAREPAARLKTGENPGERPGFAASSDRPSVAYS